MNLKEQSQLSGATVLNVLSVAGPSICIVHCLAMPFLVALLPVLGMKGLLFGISEQAACLLVVPLCALAIVPGYLKHGRKPVLLLMLAGMALVLFGSFAATALLTERAEMPVSVLGSLCLISAGLMNMRLTTCKQECPLNHPAHDDLQ
ncbi:MAG TPA: MerC domain-containing protein [Candidatus Obscuribacterales bacterium]